jgi:hypothetical protein
MTTLVGFVFAFFGVVLLLDGLSTGLPGLIVGALLLMFGLTLIFKRPAQAREKTASADDACGVHWGWWVFWTVVCWPALIFVYAVHTDKRERARK